MRVTTHHFIAFAAVLTLSGRLAPAAISAYAVPSTPSSSTWTSMDSGWAGPLNISGPLDPPYLTFQTVAGQWQAWGDLDPHFSGISQQTTALATRILATEMSQGQTFRFGFDSMSGSLTLGDVGIRNSITSAFDFQAAFSDYTYTDANGRLVDTDISTGTPVDVQVTWTNTMTNAYTASVSVIGSISPAVTWSGTLEGTAESDLLNHINGFMVSDQGSSGKYLGLQYVEVGSGVLPDPATLVPEPELVALFPLIIGGMLIRTRR